MPISTESNVLLTSDQYANTTGTLCPVCGCSQTEGHSVVIDDVHALQSITCNNCPATWTDRYTLVGYEDLNHNS